MHKYNSKLVASSTFNDWPHKKNNHPRANWHVALFYAKPPTMPALGICGGTLDPRAYGVLSKAPAESTAAHQINRTVSAKRCVGGADRAAQSALARL